MLYIHTHTHTHTHTNRGLDMCKHCLVYLSINTVFDHGALSQWYPLRLPSPVGARGRVEPGVRWSPAWPGVCCCAQRLLLCAFLACYPCLLIMSCKYRSRSTGLVSQSENPLDVAPITLGQMGRVGQGVGAKSYCVRIPCPPSP